MPAAVERLSPLEHGSLRYLHVGMNTKLPCSTWQPPGLSALRHAPPRWPVLFYRLYQPCTAALNIRSSVSCYEVFWHSSDDMCGVVRGATRHAAAGGQHDTPALCSTAIHCSARSDGKIAARTSSNSPNTAGPAQPSRRCAVIPAML